VRANADAPGLLRWTDALRDTGINDAVRQLLERSVSKRSALRDRLRTHRELLRKILYAVQHIEAPAIRT
jgi:hypothetical protein